jgi:hypothetical protein
VTLEGSGLRGDASKLQRSIVESAQENLEEWTGEKLRLTSGPNSIRVYSSSAIVSPHVNQLSKLFASAILNVAQDIEEPWPLVVVSHDGIARQITLLPGEMALIESSSSIRGFPFPLQGKCMANIMVHFELVSPTDGDIVTVDDEIHIAAQSGGASGSAKTPILPCTICREALGRASPRVGLLDNSRRQECCSWV